MFTFSLILSLLLILTAAWILGIFFARFGLPVMLGELLAGVLLGPMLLGIVEITPSIELLAELGIFFVMFHTGMEMDPKELLEHIWPALSVAVGGFVLPFALGFFVTRLFGGTLYQSLFVGMGLSVTDMAVKAVILRTMRISQTEPGHILMGATIVDNILALVALSTLIGVAQTGAIQLTRLVMVFLKVSAFFGVTILLGHFIIPRYIRRFTVESRKAFMFAMTSALLMAYLAELAGLHLVIGAFLAGQFVRKEILDDNVYEIIQNQFFGISYGFLVPIFFASLAFHLHFTWTLSLFLFSITLIFVSFIGKILGSGLGAAVFQSNPWESLVIGFGMNGRGAVELVVATIVLNTGSELMASGVISEPLLTEEQFSGLVVMAFVTTVAGPLMLKWAVSRACSSSENDSFCRLWNEHQQF